MTTTPAGGHLVDRLAPGWLVVQFLGTAMLVVALATAEERSLVMWGVYALSVTAWTLFVVLQARRPGPAAALLAVGAVLPALAAGAADDSTAVLILCVVLGRYTSLTAPSGRLIAVVTLACLLLTWISCTVAGRPPGEAFGHPLLILVLALLGLNRRQSHLRAEQAERLLGQTRLAQQEQARAAALAERTRIAREMHDVLAHSLGALSVQLKVAEALIEKGDTAAALARVRCSTRLADAGLTEARDAVAALRGDVPSLPMALERLVAAHRATHPGETLLRITGQERPLEPWAAVALTRTAREALTNAARHAAGERVEITLDHGPGAVCLTVENRIPQGRRAAAGQGPGHGLTGMRERITLVGGTLAAAAQDAGRAWVVTAEVPAPAPPSDRPSPYGCSGPGGV